MAGVGRRRTEGRAVCPHPRDRMDMVVALSGHRHLGHRRVQASLVLAQHLLLGFAEQVFERLNKGLVLFGMVLFKVDLKKAKSFLFFCAFAGSTAILI